MWPRFLVACVLASTHACDAPLEFPNTEALEEELRADPGRPGKVGAIVAVGVLQRAAQQSQTLRDLPSSSCALPIPPASRWIGELTLKRTRGDATVGRWTETRSLDHDRAGNLALRSSASYRTELGSEQAREVEWRIVGTDTWLSTHGSEGDLWSRRPAEEQEHHRIRSVVDGMIQALVDAVDGWSPAANGWTHGDEPLRCAAHHEGSAFIDRFAAAARTQEAALERRDQTRSLTATWILEDGSALEANYEDRVVQMDDLISAPSTNIVPIARDRSLHRAETLLAKLAADGLAEVASTPLQGSPEP